MGTDCLFYGSPQPLIQAMRTFQISEELRERHGYPKLTKELRAKILGLNGAALYGVEPNTSTCEFTREELEAIRRSPARTRRSGRPRWRRSRPSATTTGNVGVDRDDARVTG